ncbi:cyclic di-GMP phosphodiesterase Gmr domain protein, partial [Shigella flexneri 1235-66]
MPIGVVDLFKIIQIKIHNPNFIVICLINSV